MSKRKARGRSGKIELSASGTTVNRLSVKKLVRSDGLSPSRHLILLIIKPVLFVAIVAVLVVYNKGYDRLYKYNFKRTFAEIEKYKGLDYDERLKKLLPQDYPFLSQIRDRTPADAIILVPPKEIWHPKDRKLGFGPWIASKAYLAYFLYPRRILIDDKKDAKSPLMKDVTHVAIIDSWGYDKLQYTVPNPPSYGIMPIKQQ